MQDAASEFRIGSAYKGGNKSVVALYDQSTTAKQQLRDGLEMAKRLLESSGTLQQEEIERIVHMGEAIKSADEVFKKIAQMPTGGDTHLPEYVIHGARAVEPVISRLTPILTAEGMQKAFEKYNDELGIRTELSGGHGAYSAHQEQKLEQWEHNPLAHAVESNAYRTERSSALFGWKHDAGPSNGRLRGRGDDNGLFR